MASYIKVNDFNKGNFYPAKNKEEKLQKVEPDMVYRKVPNLLTVRILLEALNIMNYYFS